MGRAFSREEDSAIRELFGKPDWLHTAARIFDRDTAVVRCRAKKLGLGIDDEIEGHPNDERDDATIAIFRAATGRTEWEIVQVTGCNAEFVRDTLEYLLGKQMVRQVDGQRWEWCGGYEYEPDHRAAEYGVTATTRLGRYDRRRKTNHTWAGA